MNHSYLVQLLHEEITDSIDHDNSHIIRFRNRDQFQLFMQQIHRLQPSLSNLSSVREINIINAIACPVQSCRILRRFGEELTIEEDAKINLHINPMNPSIRNVPMSFHPRYRIPWGVKQIRAPQSWKQSMGNHVKIGVVDTGADYQHPDLKSCLSRGINLLNRLSPPFDDNGHGTHIAGTIAAYHPSQGITGVAPRATIHPVKAFDFNGSAFVSDIILGIDWCVANHMNIINMSFGMKARSPSLLEAVLSAYHSNVVIIASSGNDGKQSKIDYPARFSHTISVGATTKAKRVAPFSNKSKFIDVYAPGEQIFSTWLGGKYYELSGTSMATSHVTGIVALMLSLKPRLKPRQIKTILKKGATPLSSKRKAVKVEKEVVDALRSLKVLKWLSTTRKSKKK